MAEGYTRNIAPYGTLSNQSHKIDEPNNTEQRDVPDEEWDGLKEKVKQILKEVNMFLNDQTTKVQLDIRQTIKDIQNTIYPYINYKFLKADGTLPPFDEIQKEFHRVFNVGYLLHENADSVVIPDDCKTSNEIVFETPDCFTETPKCITLFDLIHWKSANRSFQPRISKNDAESLKCRYESLCIEMEGLRKNLDKKTMDFKCCLEDTAERLKSNAEYFVLYSASVTEVELETLQDHVNFNDQLKSMNTIMRDFIKKSDLEMLKNATEEYFEINHQISQKLASFLRTEITVSFLKCI